MDLKLADKSTLVSGSTGGIGLAIAQFPAQERAAVSVNGRSQARVDQAIATIKATPPTAKLSGVAIDLQFVF